jgi:hypothetical protein
MAKSRLYEMLGDLLDVNGSQRSPLTNRSDKPMDGDPTSTIAQKLDGNQRVVFGIFENLNQGLG